MSSFILSLLWLQNLFQIMDIDELPHIILCVVSVLEQVKKNGVPGGICLLREFRLNACHDLRGVWLFPYLVP
jgi:hypothetical protein